MDKGRKAFLLFTAVFFFFQLSAQEDTMRRYGFSGYREAADTLFQRLMNKKFESIRKFTIDEDAFVRETRKTDTVIPYQMIRGQYLTYWGKAERTFKKVHKKLRKSRVTQKKAVFDTVLVYRNTGNPDIIRTELYFSQKKYKAWVKFQLWRVDGLWYYNGKFELVEEKIKLKK